MLFIDFDNCLYIFLLRKELKSGKSVFDCVDQVEIRFVEFEGQALLFREVQQIIDEVHQHGGAVAARLEKVIRLPNLPLDPSDLLLIFF